MKHYYLSWSDVVHYTCIICINIAGKKCTNLLKFLSVSALLANLRRTPHEQNYVKLIYFHACGSCRMYKL